MLLKYLKLTFCIICVIASCNALAASNTSKKSNTSSNTCCCKKCKAAENKKNMPCSENWFNKPLPPYTAPETPDCHPYPPRPYALPMQGIKYAWSFGADFVFMYIQPKGSFSDFFRSQKIGGTVYLATRFRNPFGLEFGLTYTDRKPKGLNTAPGTIALNTVSTISALDTGKVRIKINYLDLQAHTRLCRYIESKIILGVGWVRQGLLFYLNPLTPTDPLQQVLLQLEGRSTWTVRLGLGAQAQITDRLGCRAFVMYQNMSAIRFRNVPVGVNPSPFHDSITANLGLYFNFLALVDPHKPGYTNFPPYPET